MSTRKTTAERIEAAKIELKQKENELKRLEQMQKEADRKARTKRLIERGGREQNGERSKAGGLIVTAR